MKNINILNEETKCIPKLPIPRPKLPWPFDF